MTQQEQLTLVEEINAKGIELLKSKGHDYAGEDVLKNFKLNNYNPQPKIKAVLSTGLKK